jgi:hypothetical protein
MRCGLLANALLGRVGEVAITVSSFELFGVETAFPHG